MEEQNFDLEFERIIQEEFAVFDNQKVTKTLSYEEEFEAKKKLIQRGMKTLFICILMVSILVVRVVTGISDIKLDAVIGVAVILTIVSVYAFLKKLKKK